MKPEYRCSITKQIVATVASAALALQPVFAYANPTGGTVSAGQASISQSGNTLDITQTSSKAVINWTGFNIAPGETTQFFQPSSGSIALNRVNSNSASEIDGNLIANGDVIIINQNGVQFGAGSRVDVNGLVATTANISDSAFMNNTTGVFNFNQPGNPNASIINNGTITAAQAGLVGLVAPNVINNGIITANLGRVQLASGDTFAVDLYGDGLMSVAVSPQVASQLVANNGLIQADGGTVQLTAAAGSQIINSLIDNQGNIEADSVGVGQSGEIILYAAGNSNPSSSNVVSNEGTISAAGNTQTSGGSVSVNAGFVANTGNVIADGQNGGSVAVTADSIYNSGTVSAQGQAGNGGTVNLSATNMIQQASSAQLNASGTAQGGNITVSAGPTGSDYDSAAYSATGTTGGNIEILGNSVTLAAATVSADGTSGGGTILIGGDAHGAGMVELADNTFVNAYTNITANAIQNGNGGTVVVWSLDATQFFGNISAKGGATSGNGGWIETSSGNTLTFGGFADASAAHGTNGSLLLDPRNITIQANTSGSPGSYIQLVDPNTSTSYGNADFTLLANGNIAVADPNATVAATQSGAAYLFNGTTGALISELDGSHAADQVGIDGITTLTGNNNFVVRNPQWNNNTGAVTWMNGTTGALSSGGIGGVISSSNSLVGSTSGTSITGDQVGLGGIATLTNGDYVVGSYAWSGGTTNGLGAVTWANGSNGQLSTGANGGVVSSASSLVGSNTGDLVSNNGSGVNADLNIIPSTSGNFIVPSACWSGGCTNGFGAVTWMNGSTGQLSTGADGGVVSSANSLVGSNAGDLVGDIAGDSFITALTNGNFVAGSRDWDGGSTNGMGAVTWISGSTGELTNSATGSVISSSTSLVGSHSGDLVGVFGITQLTNGNYVVASYNWNNYEGAVTWGNGSTGTAGVVSSTNSLVGSTGGSSAGDKVGVQGVTALSSGNYVVNSPYWHGGGTAGFGAVTWGNGSTGTVGTVSASNSLVGSHNLDYVGSDGITQLTNGNYVVDSASWDSSAGAVTWVNGSNGQLVTGSVGGTVSATNSLIGAAGSYVGYGGNDGLGVTALPNGNYVVVSEYWTGGLSNGEGAVTFGCGSAGNTCASNGIIGTVSASNSLVGSHAKDFVGGGTGGGFGGEDNDGVTVLTNGNYVVDSPNWDSNEGAVTWVNGSNGALVTGSAGGVVASTNSLVGSHTGTATTGDLVGDGNQNGILGGTGIVVLSNGNYVVDSPYWDGGWTNGMGAVTFGCGSAGNACGANGVIGVVSASNSLVGSHTSDHVGVLESSDFSAITVLPNGNYVVESPIWNSNEGAVTWVNGSNGQLSDSNVGEVVSSSNSLVGSTTGDLVGYSDGIAGGNGIVTLTNGNYVVSSSQWGDGKGAVTWVNGSNGELTTGANGGTISSSNSLVGTTADDGSGTVGDFVGNGGITALSNGNYVVDSPSWGGGAAHDGKGAVTFGCGSASNSCGSNGIIGTVSSSNSLVGSTADDGSGTVGDFVGEGSIWQLSNDNYVVSSPYWNGGTTNGMGAVTWVNGINGQLSDGNVGEAVSSSNSFVGTHSGDLVGYSIDGNVVLPTSNGGFVVGSPNYNSGVGEIYVFEPSTSASLPQSYGTTPGSDVTITTGTITAITASGTSVTLQANNDITLAASSHIDTTGALGSTGGAITLDAGRSIILDSSITTNNGALTLLANDTAADGVVNADRLSGTAAITMASGTTLNTGTGALSITIGTGAGNTNTTSGDITLYGITAGNITVANNGPSSGNIWLDGTIASSGNMSFYTGGDITSSAAGIIAQTSSGAQTLSMEACSNITIGGAIGTTAELAPYLGEFYNFAKSVGPLAITLDSNYANANSGYIDIESNLTSNNGAITMGGGSGAITAGSGYAWGNAGETAAVTGLGGYGTAGIFIDTGVTISSGSSTIIMNGHGGNTNTSSGGESSGSNIGVYSGGTISGNDGITIYGTGGSNTAASGDTEQEGDNHGIIADDTISASAGTITFNGTGGSTTYSGSPSNTEGYNFGVYTGGDLTATGNATISITGQGGTDNGTSASASSQVGKNSGVFLGGIMQTAGNITINGTGGTTTFGSGGTQLGENYGINLNGDLFATGTAVVSVTGTGGTQSAQGTDGYNHGVFGGGIIEVVNGALTINGTAANSLGSNSIGVAALGGNFNSSGSGNISITGTGSTTDTTSGDEGVDAAASNITMTNTGTLIITGTGGGGNGSTGGNNDGVSLSGASINSSHGGTSITITGTAGPSGSVGTSYDIGTNSAYPGFTGYAPMIEATNGNITFNANTLLLTGSAFGGISTTSSGIISFLPRTAGTSIGFSGGAGTLQVSQALMDYIYAPTVVVGSTSDTGALTTGAFNWEYLLTTLKLEEGGAAGSITIGGNITKGVDDNSNANTTAGTLDLYSGSNILVNNSISSSSTYGALNLYFDSNYANASSGFIDVEGNITTNNGTLTMGGGSAAITAGTGFAWGNAANTNGGAGVAIGYVNDVTVNAGTANVIINGHGYNNATGSNNYGIYVGKVTTGSTLETGTGNITINGTGGNGEFSNNGIQVDGTITTTSGAISLTGTGGTAGTAISDYDNLGIEIFGTVSSTATGTVGAVGITGTGAAAYQENYGVWLDGGTISVAGANLTITGTGGNGTSSTAGDYGIYTIGFSAIESTGSGTITMTGKGGHYTTGSTTVGDEYGIYTSSSTIESLGTGSLTIKGYGGKGLTGNLGLYNVGTITSASGALDVEGYGGTDGTTSTYTLNAGLDNNGTISDTCTSSCGAFTIIGTGATAYSSNIGIFQAGTLSTVAANLTITGTGAGSSTGNYGTDITSAITGTGAGTITINGTGGGGAAPIYLGANVTNDNAAITFNNAATLAGNVTINAGTGTTTFASTVDGGDTLTVTDSGGAVMFDSKVGGTTALTSLTTTGNTTLDGNVTTTGVQIYNSAVTLGAADTLTTTNSNVTFGSTLDGAYALVVASGTGTDTYTGVAGGGTPLTSINDSSATGTTAIDASITTTGTQNYAGAVTLGGDATLTTTNSNVTFGTTVNGAHNLAVAAGTGNVTYTGIVGGSAVLTSLNDSSSTGTSVLDGNVTTTGAQSYAGTVTLGNNDTLTTNNSNVTFGGAVNGTHTLTIAQGSGTTTFAGNVGTGTALSTINDSGTGTIDLDGNITTSNASATLHGPVVLGANSTISLGTGTFTTGSTVNGDFNLNATAATFSLGGAIGGSTPLNNVTLTSTNALTLPAISAVTLTASSSATATDITVGGALALSGTSGNDVSLSAYRNITDNASVTTQGGSIIFDANNANTSSGYIDIEGNVTSNNGNITLGGGEATPTNIVAGTGYAWGNAGETSAVTGLGGVGTAGIYIASAVTVNAGSGNIILNGQGGNTNTDEGGVVSIGNNYGVYNRGTVTSTGGISIYGTGGSNTAAADDDEQEGANYGIYSNGTLSAGNGGITLSGNGGGTTFSGSGFTGNGTNYGIKLNGTLQTTGTGVISITGMGGTQSAGGTSGDNFGISDNATISVVDGTITLNGTGGGTSTLDYGTYILSGITSTGIGTITVNGTGGNGSVPIYLAANVTTDNTAVAFNDAVTLGGNSVVNAGTGLLTFASTVDGAHSLTATGGPIDFDAAIGSGTALTSLSATSATGINLDGSVTTTGTQTYTGPAVIGANDTMTTTNSAVDFTSTVNDGTSNTHSLTVSAGSGLITFGGSVGTTELASLSATSTTGIDVNGSVTTGGTQSYTGAVVIAGNDTLTTTNSAVDFTSTINDGTSNTHSLTVSAGNGLITFGGTVGTTELASLAATSTIGIDINGSVTTGGTQTYTGPAVIGANDTLTTTNSAVDFTSTVNDGTSNTHSLTVSAGNGLITFGGTVGTTELASLAATSTTGINLDGSVTTGGTQTYTGPAVIGANDSLTTNNSAVDFTSTVDDATSNTHSLTISAGNGLITFGGAVGTSKLASLAATSTTGIDLGGSVTTGGTQTYTGPAVIGANDTLTTTNSAVDFTSTVNDGTSNTHSLTVAAGSGLVTFGNTVGTTELASLAATSSAGIYLGGNVTTGGNQTYTGPVVLGASDTLTTTNSNVTFGGTVNGAHALTVDSGTGNVTFAAAVGGSTALTSLYVDPATIYINGNVTTAGDQTYDGNVVLTNSVTLSSNSSGAGGNITFDNEVDGDGVSGRALTLTSDSGTDTFSGVVGFGTPLLSLADTASAIDLNGGNITTTGNQTYTGPVALGTNTVLATTNSPVDFAGTVDGGYNLTVKDKTGGTVFGGVVGGSAPLGNLTLIGDTVSLSGNVSGNGTLTIQPSTAAQPINLNNGSTGLYLTTAEIGDIQSDWSGVTIGSALDSATLDAGTATWKAPLTLQSGTGTIEFSGNQTMGGNTIVAVSNSGNIQLDGNVSITTTSSTANAIILAAGGDFVNNSGSTSPLTASSSNWIVYSTSPGADTDGASVMNPATTEYSHPFYSNTSGASGNSWFYSSASGSTNEGTIDITANNQTITYGNAMPSLTYSCSGAGCADIAGGLAIYTGIGGVTSSTSGNYNAGTWTNDIIQGSLTWASGFTGTIDYTAATLQVNTRTLTLPGFAVSGKTYNGSTAATISSNGTLSNVVTGLANGGPSSGNGLTDGVGLVSTSASATFGSANVGTQTAQASGYTLSGADASDYTLTQPTATAAITAENITIKATNQSQTYGFGGTSAALGTTGYTVTSGTIYNADITGATLSTNATTSTSGNYNAGTWNITPTGVSGPETGNYNITYTTDTGGLAIAKKTLTDTGFAVAGRTYDGLTDATITSDGTLSGVVTGLANGGGGSGNGLTDGVSLSSGSATFGSKNAGSETATGSYTLAGADASDYTLTAPTASATIGKATLDITAGAQSTTYGNTLGMLTYTSSGLQTGDSLNGGALGVINENSTTSTAGTVLSHAGGFDVASGPFAIVQNTLGVSDGNAGNNYNIVYTGANLTLAAKALTDTGFAVSGRTYDGLTDATISSNGTLTNGGSSSGDGEYITGDIVSIAGGGTATFGSKNAGSETATASLSLTGAQAGDYTLTQPTASATITAEALTITAQTSTKTYDGTTKSVITPSITSGSIMTGDSAGFSETYSGKNVGTGLTLTPSGIVSDGNSGNNYTYTYDTNGTGVINAKALTVTANNQTIIVGSPDPTLTYSYTGLASGDSSASFTGALARTGGDNVGTYSIVQNTLAATGNYTIGTFNDGVFTISAANTFSIADIPSTVFIVSQDPSLNIDNPAAARTDSDNAGTYSIVQGTPPAANYIISKENSGVITISLAPTTGTPDATGVNSQPAFFKGLMNGNMLDDTNFCFGGGEANLEIGASCVPHGAYSDFNGGPNPDDSAAMALPHAG